MEIRITIMERHAIRMERTDGEIPRDRSLGNLLGIVGSGENCRESREQNEKRKTQTIAREPNRESHSRGSDVRLLIELRLDFGFRLTPELLSESRLGGEHNGPTVPLLHSTDQLWTTSAEQKVH